MTKGDNMNTKTTIQRISVITALALSVCTSSALAHHPTENNWKITGGNNGGGIITILEAQIMGK